MNCVKITIEGPGQSFDEVCNFVKSALEYSGAVIHSEDNPYPPKTTSMDVSGRIIDFVVIHKPWGG